ncbi:hypothetical protein BBJ28_00003059 [Nothophytophthora sp. Chile5]|nr:hypothetical protein BBJ28_00003059 [Nothophytophthora sp. Chile5]
MTLVFPNMTMSSEMAVRETEPSALPLALATKAPLLPSLRVRAQWASCATMTKSFLAKAFPSPQLQLWRLQSSSPTGVEDSTEASAVSEAISEPENEATDAARGEICELIVVAVQRNDAEYHQVTIDVSSVAPGAGEKRRLGQVAVDLNAEFSRPTGPLHKRSALTTSDGTRSNAEVHYVIHRLAVKNAAASAASRVLTRSLSSLNDADDMDAYGQIFPDLWYLC